MSEVKRDTGFYGGGTPQVAIYRPVGYEQPLSSSVDPWVEPNGQPPYSDMEIPVGTNWGWCIAFQNVGRDYEVVLCDFSGPEKRTPDPVTKAPGELQELIGGCPPRYRSRAILETAKGPYIIKPGEVQEV